MSKIESPGEPTPHAVLRGHDNEVQAVECVELDGRPVAVSVGNDGTLWDLATAEPDGPPLPGHDGEVMSAACAVLDGRPVAVTGGADGTLRVWDLAARAPMAPPIRHDEDMPVHRVVTARLDGRPIALSAGPASMAYDGEGEYYSGGLVRVWDLATGEAVGRPFPETEHTAGIACAELDGRLVAVVSDYRRARVFGLPAAIQERCSRATTGW
jgi:hypothetical protein